MRFAVLLVALLISGCSWLAVATAPAKVPQASSAEGQAAAAQFWDVLRGGRYEQIDAALETHMRVLVKEPNDALTLAHTGWLNAWKFSERARLPPAARIVEHATQARRYFDEAVLLAPDEARYLSFAAAFMMVEASILKNEKQLRQGYFRMKDAVSLWPEFNLFTSGYSMSSNATDSDAFREGLAQQWETLDRCFGERVSRQATDLSKYLALETQTGVKRVCWNSWIAPHDFEGFFLNFGDMLARANDLPNARTMYQTARLLRTYPAWPYREVLERRLAQLDALPRRLNQPAVGEREWVSVVSSSFSCMGCHQRGASPVSHNPFPIEAVGEGKFETAARR